MDHLLPSSKKFVKIRHRVINQALQVPFTSIITKYDFYFSGSTSIILDTIKGDPVGRLISRNNILVSLSIYGDMEIWNISSFTRKFHIKKAHVGRITSWMFIDDHQLFSYDRNEYKIWNVDTGTLITQLQANKFSSFTVHEGKLVSGAHNGEIAIWDTQGHMDQYTMTDGMPITHLLSIQGVIISGRSNGIMMVWDLETNTYLLGGHNRGIRFITQLDKDTFISGANDLSMKIWNVKTRQVVRTIEDVGPPIKVLPWGTDLMVQSERGSIYHVSRYENKIGEHTNMVSIYKLGPKIVSYSEQSIRVWNIEGMEAEYFMQIRSFSLISHDRIAIGTSTAQILILE